MRNEFHHHRLHLFKPEIRKLITLSLIDARRWIGLLFVSTVLALCGTADAAQPAGKIPRLGVLTWSDPPAASAPSPVDQILNKLGYVEKQNILIERQYANGQLERLPELAVELVRHSPDVILAQSFPAAIAAKHATATIPIVIMGAGDPVATGLVASFARPGGNVTGVSALETELSGKRLDLLKETFPKLASIALIWNAADLGMTFKYRELERAAQGLRVSVHALGVREAKDFDNAFSEMTTKRPDALFVITDPLTQSNRKHLLNLGIKSKLPAMYENSSYVDDGGLMAYGPSQADNLQRALYHVDRILKGTKPSDLPIEQPTKFEFIVNLKTATQIGVTIPPNVLVRADKVLK